MSGARGSTSDGGLSRPGGFAVVAGIAGIVAVIVCGLVVAGPGEGRPFDIDRAWHDLLAAHRWVLADVVANALDLAGGVLPMSILTALLCLVLWFRGRPREAITIAASVAVAAGICTIVKVLVSRPRPADATVDVSSDSFPSGHTTVAAALAVALLLAFPAAWSRVLAVVWIPVMAASRDYLLVHWLSDVIVAGVLGVSVAVLVAAGVRALVARGFLKEPSPDRARFRGESQAGTGTLKS